MNSRLDCTCFPKHTCHNRVELRRSDARTCARVTPVWRSIKLFSRLPKTRSNNRGYGRPFDQNRVFSAITSNLTVRFSSNCSWLYLLEKFVDTVLAETTSVMKNSVFLNVQGDNGRITSPSDFNCSFKLVLFSSKTPGPSEVEW